MIKLKDGVLIFLLTENASNNNRSRSIHILRPYDYSYKRKEKRQDLMRKLSNREASAYICGFSDLM